MNAAVTGALTFELEDDWEAINAWFLDNDLTDGLPIVPPPKRAYAR